MSGYEHLREHGYNNYLMSISLSHLMSPDVMILKAQTPPPQGIFPFTSPRGRLSGENACLRDACLLIEEQVKI